MQNLQAWLKVILIKITSTYLKTPQNCPVIRKIFTNLLKYTSQFKVSSFIKKRFEIFDLNREIPYTLFRIHLKNVFWPNIFVGASFSSVAGFPIWSYATDSGIKSHPDPRKYPRKPCLKSVFFNCGDQRYAGLIKNISRGGVFIETADKFLFGQSIELIISNTRIDRGKPIPGWIVHLCGDGVGSAEMQ